jgi:hypothetical protein
VSTVVAGDVIRHEMFKGEFTYVGIVTNADELAAPLGPVHVLLAHGIDGNPPRMCFWSNTLSGFYKEGDVDADRQVR